MEKYSKHPFLYCAKTTPITQKEWTASDFFSSNGYCQWHKWSCSQERRSLQFLQLSFNDTGLRGGIWGLVRSEESTHTDTHQSISTVLCVMGASSSLGLLKGRGIINNEERWCFHAVTEYSGLAFIYTSPKIQPWELWQKPDCPQTCI